VPNFTLRSAIYCFNHLHFNGHFPGYLVPPVSSSTGSRTENLGISGTGFLQGACPSCNPTNMSKNWWKLRALTTAFDLISFDHPPLDSQTSRCCSLLVTDHNLWSDLIQSSTIALKTRGFCSLLVAVCQQHYSVVPHIRNRKINLWVNQISTVCPTDSPASNKSHQTLCLL